MPSAESLDSADPRSRPASSLKPFSISLSKAKPLLSTTKTINHRKRPHSSLAEDDSETEDPAPKAQLVSAFDHSAGGAIGIDGREERDGPLVIPVQKNRDWRDESHSKRGKNLLPAEVQAAQTKEGGQDVAADKDVTPPSFGLAFAQAKEKDSNGDVTMADISSVQNTQSKPDPGRPRNEDDEALEALLGNGVKKSNLVLPVAGTDRQRRDAWTQRGNEDDDFRSDVASRPESASLEEYTNVPVEIFGAALLRGMKPREKGSRSGEERKDLASKPRELVRRPALLGIGAKDTPDGVEELGAWGKAAKTKGKIERNYHPILLKNSVTGEMISEEEMEKRKQNQKVEEEYWRERRDKNLALDAEKKDRRRFEASEDGPRINHSRRDRSRSAEPSRRTSSKQDKGTSSRRERSRSSERSRYGSSRRDRSPSSRKSHHSSSKRPRSRSKDRRPRNRGENDVNGDHERDERDRHRRDQSDDKEDYRYSKARHHNRARDSDDRDTHRSSKH